MNNGENLLSIILECKTKIDELERESINSINELYRLENSLESRIDILYENLWSKIKMYEELTEFERELARFGDKVALIAGLEVGGKMKAEEAYQEIKKMYKNLKKVRKIENT